MAISATPRSTYSHPCLALSFLNQRNADRGIAGIGIAGIGNSNSMFEVGIEILFSNFYKVFVSVEYGKIKLIKSEFDFFRY